MVSRLGNIFQDFSEAIADQLGMYPPMFLSYKDMDLLSSIGFPFCTVPLLPSDFGIIKAKLQQQK